MPNWCANNVEIYHDDPKMIEKVVGAFKRGELCETFLPIKHLPTDQQYDAAINSWGTKWDVAVEYGGGVSVGDHGHRVWLTFESAWSPPTGLYGELERLGFEVFASYFEPGVGFVGRYENGSDECFEFSGDNFEKVVPADLLKVYDIGDWFDFDEGDRGE